MRPGGFGSKVAVTLEGQNNSQRSGGTPSTAVVSMSSVDGDAGGSAFKVGLTLNNSGWVGGGGGGLYQPTEEAQQEAQELRAEA